MLEYIRSNAQSFGVKLVFGVIILVFVFWGVGSFSDKGGRNLAATVNGEPITARDFEMAYRNAEESLLRNNPGLTREQLKAQQLGRQVLRDLVTQSLLRQEAARMGISVSPLELRLAVGQIKAFQNDKGDFDPAAYKRVLQAQRLSPADFEQETSADLLRRKLFALVTAGAWTDPADARQRYNFLRQKRTVDYIFLPASNFMDKVKPTDAQAQAYYEAHKAAFAVPAKVKAAYIRVRPQDLVNPENIDAAAARRWYDANSARFTQEEQVKAAHILVPLAEDAPQAEVRKAQETAASIEKELAAGKSFAAVADAHNGPNAAGPGGELGWLKRGATVKPFEDAAFALAPGQVSAPVRSPFGLHIIKVEEKKPGGVTPFEKALPDVRRFMAAEQGADKLHDVLDSLIEDNILGKPLAASARRFGLTAEETDLAAATELEKTLGVKPDAAQTLVNMPAGAPLDTALEAGDAYVVARVLAAEPAATESFDKVKDKIFAALTEEQALAAALQAAAERRKELRDGPLNPTFKQGLGARTPAPLERGGALEGFAPEPALAEAVFSAPVDAWLPTAYAVQNLKEGKGALLAHVAAVLPPDVKEWETVKDIMQSAVTRERGEGLFEVFMQRLLVNAKIEVNNPDLVDRKNM